MLIQRGFSLVELMIGSTVGLLVIAGALQLYTLNLRATSDNLRLSRLNQELRATLELLRGDLRRAGYWALQPGSDFPEHNPFQSAANDIQLGAAGGEADASCILYSYDRNGDGLVGVGPSGTPGSATSNANLEQFGLRLRNAQAQLRSGGSSFSCDSGSWQAITDPDTEITQLQFEIASACFNLQDTGAACSSGAAALLHRQVRITLAARSHSDNSISHSITHNVSIANDKLFATYP